MESIERTSASPDIYGLVIASTFGNLVDLYWLALASFQNTLEDISGSDGRVEYLVSLRCKLIEVCQEMDDLLSGMPGGVAAGHRLAVAMECGMPNFGVSAGDIAELSCFTLHEAPHDELQAALLAFGESFVRRLPGQIPDAQGPLGQGQTLRAMRNWSAAAAKTGDQLDFLAERFRQF